MSTSNRISLLQGMAVFGAISSESLTYLLDEAKEVNVARGASFFVEDDEGTEMYVLESGRVELLKRWAGEQRWLAELGPGDCFGEMALMDFQRRSATARAVQDCRALQISVAALYGLYERDLEQFVIIQMNMGREVSRRLRIADERIFEAEINTADRDAGYLT